MALPAFVTRSYGGGAVVAQLTQEIGPSDTSFTISPTTGWTEANGSPLGTDGPFTVVVDRFTNSVEKIYCSAINLITGVVTVETSGGSGRGYDGTTPQAHVPGGSTSGVQTCWSSIEAAEANKAVVALIGAIQAAGDLIVGTGLNATGRLAVGAAGALLDSNGTTPGWLAPGTNGQLLKIVGSTPTWSTGAAGVTGVPAGRIHLNAATTVVHNLAPVPFDTQDFVTGSMTSDLVTNYSLIAPVTGYYQVDVGLSATPAGSPPQFFTVQLFKNGSTTISQGSAMSTATSALTGGVALSDVVHLTATDYVSVLYVGGTTTDVVNGGAGPTKTYFSLSLISS